MTVFDDSLFYTGPELTPELVRAAEQELGYRLPASYIELLGERNGGSLRHGCVMTPFPTSWGPGHIEIRAIRGIGGRWGIDSAVGRGSAYLIGEWGYPDIGIVVCTTPSGGHDTVMLDYRECGPTGEPSVAYIDEGRHPRTIAASFAELLAALTECPEIDDEDEIDL